MPARLTAPSAMPTSIPEDDDVIRPLGPSPLRPAVAMTPPPPAVPSALNPFHHPVVSGPQSALNPLATAEASGGIRPLRRLSYTGASINEPPLVAGTSIHETPAPHPFQVRISKDGSNGAEPPKVGSGIAAAIASSSPPQPSGPRSQPPWPGSNHAPFPGPAQPPPLAPTGGLWGASMFGRGGSAANVNANGHATGRAPRSLGSLFTTTAWRAPQLQPISALVPRVLPPVGAPSSQHVGAGGPPPSLQHTPQSSHQQSSQHHQSSPPHHQHHQQSSPLLWPQKIEPTLQAQAQVQAHTQENAQVVGPQAPHGASSPGRTRSLREQHAGGPEPPPRVQAASDAHHVAQHQPSQHLQPQQQHAHPYELVGGRLSGEDGAWAPDARGARSSPSPLCQQQHADVPTRTPTRLRLQGSDMGGARPSLDGPGGKSLDNLDVADRTAAGFDARRMDGHGGSDGQVSPHTPRGQGSPPKSLQGDQDMRARSNQDSQLHHDERGKHGDGCTGWERGERLPLLRVREAHREGDAAADRSGGEHVAITHLFSPTHERMAPVEGVEMRVRICVLTWNMNGKVAPTPCFELVGGEAHPHDIVVCGTQEAPANGLCDPMAVSLGPTFRRLAHASLQGIQLSVFVRKELLGLVSDVRTDSIATGIGNVWGNKGGAAVTFMLANVRLLFVNSHLAAHQRAVAARNDHFYRICAGLFSRTRPPAPGQISRLASTPSRTTSGNLAWADHPASPMSPVITRLQGQGSGIHRTHSGMSNGRGTPGGEGADTPQRLAYDTLASPGGSSGSLGDDSERWDDGVGEISGGGGKPLFLPASQHKENLIHNFDVIVWMGDLNYRVEGNRAAIDMALREQMWEVLHANDQLSKERARGKVFVDFHEGPLSFPPTYKFDNGTDVYDTSEKRRIPSWTDRVLFKYVEQLEGHLSLDAYDSVRQLKSSDHKPVRALFSLRVTPGASPLAKPCDQTCSRFCSIQ